MEHPTLPDREFKPYLDRIARGLDRLPAAEREDVLREIRSHLEDGLAAGESASVMIDRMGTPESVAEAIVSERLVAVDRRRSPAQLAAIVLQATALPFVMLFIIFATLELMSRANPPSEVWSLARMLENWKTIGLLVLPWALMMLGAFGLPKLHRELSPARFHRVLPGLMAAIMGVSLLVTGVVYAAVEGYVPAAISGIQREDTLPEIRKDRNRELAEWQRLDQKYGAITTSERVKEQYEHSEQHLQLKSAWPFLHLGAGALGLSLGYLFRRRAFAWVVLAAGGGAIALCISAMLMMMGSMTSPFPMVAIWSGLIFEWLMVMTVWVVAMFRERRHVQ